MKFDGLRHEELAEKHLDQYKLVLPNLIDEVMSERNIALLDRLVRERGARMLEGDNPTLKRHYTLLYHETPGTYRQRFPAVPDGTWFLDEMVSDQKLGLYTGKELREQGLPVVYGEG